VLGFAVATLGTMVVRPATAETLTDTDIAQAAVEFVKQTLGSKH
jgi:hypothetical protein